MLRIAAVLIVTGLLVGCMTPPPAPRPTPRYEVTAAALPGKDGNMESWIIRTDRVTGKTWRYETRKTRSGPNSFVVRTGWYPLKETAPVAAPTP